MMFNFVVVPVSPLPQLCSSYCPPPSSHRLTWYCRQRGGSAFTGSELSVSCFGSSCNNLKLLPFIFNIRSEWRRRNVNTASTLLRCWLLLWPDLFLKQSSVLVALRLIAVTSYDVCVFVTNTPSPHVDMACCCCWLHTCGNIPISSSVLFYSIPLLSSLPISLLCLTVTVSLWFCLCVPACIRDYMSWPGYVQRRWSSQLGPLKINFSSYSRGMSLPRSIEWGIKFRQ